MPVVLPLKKIFWTAELATCPQGCPLLTTTALCFARIWKPIRILFSLGLAGIRPMNLRTVNVTRYVTPLREGGSLPAIVEADDGFLYVLKFRGAGQGVKALIAEVIGGEIARALGFRVPEIVFGELDEAFGRIEGDEEIQDLLKASTGLNLGLHYLSGALTFDPVAHRLSAEEASGIVWVDSLLLNVDRTCRNTNLLMWHKELWLIDHGASLYFHHSWTEDWNNPARNFPNIRQHVLLPYAPALEAVNEKYCCILSIALIREIVELVPDGWLTDPAFESPAAQREAYVTFLHKRIENSSYFVKEANDARQALV